VSAILKCKTPQTTHWGNKELQKNKKMYFVCIIAISLLSMAALAPASAAGAITATPNTFVTSGSSVSVTGTGFGASKSVGIGFGIEVVVTSEVHTTFSGTGMGPYTATLDHYPIKPGSFSMHWDTAGTTSDWTDKGDGTLTSDSAYNAGATMNYATGVFGRSSTTDLSTYALTATCTYTYYQYKVTPTAGITTNGAGGFTATITVPSVTNGVYTLTAVDLNGTKGTTSIGVGVDVPESLTVGVVVLLSFAAVAGGAVLLRKPKTRNIKLGKL
jgi:hypothetical protein